MTRSSDGAVLNFTAGSGAEAQSQKHCSEFCCFLTLRYGMDKFELSALYVTGSTF